MKTIGIDAALAETGWVIIEDDGRLTDWGVISTDAGDKSGKAEFERVRALRFQISEVLAKTPMPKGDKTNVLTVAIERTDWIHGSEMGREAKARGSLGLGVAAAYLACDDFGIVPYVLGVREWMNLFGTRSKNETAIMVARCYSALFCVEHPTPRLRRNRKGELTGGLVGDPIIRTIEDGKRVPSHVTDAIALALVVQRLIALERRANG
ncbi:hypothetical protein ANRL1_02860 [Anaerolineae bacterium]|nr:hypothetical protein ANRL1_02860 [Anaerolineae bacterium]